MHTIRAAASRPTFPRSPTNLSSTVELLPVALRLGAVHLSVPDVERALSWYERSLGLVRRGDSELGDESETLVVLHEDPEARPPGRHAGLYHYALLYPDRAALAHAAMRLVATQTPIQGASDHGTHEAIYLADGDGNGIELAADRPREQWLRGLGYGHGPAPLEFRSLLAATSDQEPSVRIADGVRVGHMHLHVGDVDEALRFYRDVLGFEEQANLGSAAFVSAGGYHHHLGLNVWRGRGVSAPPPHTIGLEHWTVLLPTDADIAAVRERVEAAGFAAERSDGSFRTRDPWGTAVVFRRVDEFRSRPES